MKKFVLFFIVAIGIILSILALGKNVEVPDYRITFIVNEYEYFHVKTSGNEIIEMPPDPNENGYTFAGWYLDEEFTVSFTSTTYLNKDLREDINVYAKFTINNYTITFNSNGGSYVAPISQNYNTTVIKPEDPTKSGMTFAGWYTDNETFNNPYTFTTMPSENITLYAKWNITTYAITYNLDGGENGNNPTTYTINTSDILLIDAHKVGYTFNGWYTEQTFINKVLTIQTSLAKDYTLYAKFTINDYTITFNSNGGSYVAPINQNYNTTVIKPEDPTKSGMTFAGWYTDNETFNNPYTFTNMPSENITLYAKWETDNGIVIEQTSVNVIGDKLSQVKIKCLTHTDCTVYWQNGNLVLNTTLDYYTAYHISSDGTVDTVQVAVSATNKLEDIYIYNDMLFTLNHTNLTASVKANTDTIERAIIPESVTCNGRTYTVNSLDYKAFYGIDTLVYVSVPKTIVSSVGSSFAQNKNLTTVVLDKDMTFLFTQMFMYCGSLQSITIPEGVTQIPYGLLYGCKSITSINIPKGVTEIESFAFFGTSLTEISLPEGLQKIDNGAFSGIKVNEIVVPSTVNSIGKNAFASINTLTKLKILSKNITIGNNAFTYCTNLREIYLNSSQLVNSITTDTSDSTCLISNLKNGDILYINETIVVTSIYINEMFTEVTSAQAGYKAYNYGKYSQLIVNNFINRVYEKGSSLYGDETIEIKDPNGNTVVKPLDITMVEFFDTKTIGKKLASITYKFNVVNCEYYVLSTIDSNELNCISGINNFYSTYYVGETVNWSTITMNYCYNNNGKMINTIVTVNASMVEGFNTNTAGSRFVTFNYNNLTYQLKYNVKEKSSEKITSESFDDLLYFANYTVEKTEHFIINLQKGSFVAKNYRQIIETVYNTMQEVTGLQFAPQITLDVNSTNYPSCGGLTLYINPEDLRFFDGTSFVHELSHALEHSQIAGGLATSVLTEGFATYVEYLTTKELYLTDPETYACVDTMKSVINGVDSLDTKIYFYDFEDYLLNLGRDELVANSQYEVGCKLFAYLDYRYGDFCSWIKDSQFKSNTLTQWTTNIKSYYNNINLFAEIYEYYQKSGDKYSNLLGADHNTNLTSRADLTAINKVNYYLNFQVLESYMGNISIIYKDLYVNIESAREQLNKNGIVYTSLYLSSSKNVEIELYDANGTLIKKVTNSTTAFSLQGVSFIKLCGTNHSTFNLTYR